MGALVQDKNNLFINPYNFVSMTSKVKRDFKADGELTGYISCSLKVKEAVVIPNRDKAVEEATEAKGATYNFYNINGNPVIPGSEIRGCIRSVFEAVTPSCFSVINDNILSHRQPSPSSTIKPGILERHNGRWQVFEAKYRDSKRRYKEKEKNLGVSDLCRRWQVNGDEVKLDNAYFYKHNGEFSCSNKDVDKFITALEIYLKNTEDYEEHQEAVDEKRDIINGYIKAINGMKNVSDSAEKIPVFFNISKDKILYFSPAQTGRIVFDNSIDDLLGEHSRCTGQEGYCPACSLFGSLGDNKPVASKLRFEDAAGVEVKLSDYIVLPELSSPKVSSVEFYSYKGKERYHTKMWGYDDTGVALRGRKFYFHSKCNLGGCQDFGKRQIRSQAALEGSLFKFKLYFDKIDSTELKQLLWVLTFGENSINGNIMHKIGAGRPVGFGSVKIAVDNIILRNFDSDNFNYNIEKKHFNDYKYSIDEADLFESDALKDMKTIADYNFVNGYNVSYPIADTGEENKNAKAGHQWFTGNRKPDNTFGEILPKLNDNPEKLRMYSLKPFEIDKEYTAFIYASYTNKKGLPVVKAIVGGYPVSLNPRHLPYKIQNDLDNAIKNKSQITVVYKGLNKNKQLKFWVNKY